MMIMMNATMTKKKMMMIRTRTVEGDQSLLTRSARNFSKSAANPLRADGSPNITTSRR